MATVALFRPRSMRQTVQKKTDFFLTCLVDYFNKKPWHIEKHTLIQYQLSSPDNTELSELLCHNHG